MRTVNAESMGAYGASWEAVGYSGSGNVAGLIGSLHGRPAVVAGNAEGVFDEVTKACAALEDPVVFAANDVGIYLPKLDHWVTLHSDNMGVWKPARWVQSHAQEQTKYHLTDAKPFSDYVWEGVTPLFALSGYFAMQIAWIMGAEQIVLCGCPGSPKRRFFEAQSRDDFGYGSGTVGADKGIREQIEREMRRLPGFKARVKSMSGFTREFFGSL